MRNIAILTVLTAALAATVAYAADGDSPKGNDAKAAPAAAAPAAKAAAVTEFKDMKWSPLDPSNPKGPQVSIITGDMKTGPVEFLLKVPAGFKAPVHSHTSDYYAVEVAGAHAHGDDEKSAKSHAIGSTYFEPAKHAHFDSCTSKEDCLTLVYFPNGFDFIPADAPKTAAATTGKKTK
jgi:hypothetical protein